LDSPPTVTIAYPQNITYNVNVSELNYTATDDNSLSACWYSIDGGITNSSSDPTCSNFTNVISSEGSNTWTVYVNDSIGNENRDDITFSKDTIIPLVNFVNPTTNTSNLSQNFIEANVTASDDNLDTITINLYNSTGLVQSNTSSTSSFFINFTGLPDETYSFNSTVNDTAGNENITETRTIILDTINPTISYVAPTESDGLFINSNFISINVTATDDNLDTIIIRLYNSSNNQINSSTTTSSPNFINFTGLTDGLYFYNSTANDTVGNKADLATRNITLDTINPSITSLTENPTDPTTYTQGVTYEFNATISDTNLESVLIEFDSINYTPTNSIGNVYNFTISDLAAGTYNYIWYSNDSAGNINSTVTQTYTINNASGDITLLINDTASNQLATYLTQTNASAGTQFGTVTLYRDGSDVTNENNVFVTLGVGYYNYTAVSSGDENHSSASITRFVNITKANSEVNLTLNETSVNVTIDQGSSIYLNLTTISGDSGATLKLYNNGTLINQGSSPLSNLTTFSTPLSNLTTFSTIGVFNITGFYIESQNYTGNFKTLYVNVTTAPDITNPDVTSLTENPTDPATYSEGGTYEFNITATDNIAVEKVVKLLSGEDPWFIKVPLLYNFKVAPESPDIVVKLRYIDDP